MEALGLFTSTVSASNLDSVRVYVPHHDTSPPDSGVCSLNLEVETERITTISLNGASNYHAWARTVERFLFTKGKESHLYSPPPDPESKASEYAKWSQEDALIIILMSNCMDKEVYRGVVFLSTAKEIWETLETLYSSKDNLQRLYDIFEEIATTSQGEGEDVRLYIAKYYGLLEEWKICQPISTDIAVQMQQRETLISVLLLANMKPYLGGVRSHLLATRKSLTLSDVLAALKRVPVLDSKSYPKTSALDSMQGRGRSTPGRNAFSFQARGRGGRNSKFCSSCPETNHVYEYCYQRTGQPSSGYQASASDITHADTSAADFPSSSSNIMLTNEVIRALKRILSDSSSITHG